MVGQDTPAASSSATSSSGAGSTKATANLKSHSFKVAIDIDVFEVGRRAQMLWSRDGRIIAGLGVAKRIPITRPAGFDQAQEELFSLSAERDEPHDESQSGPKTAAQRVSHQLPYVGAGPVAFAALGFDPTEPGELIVPEIVLVKDKAGRRWITITNDRPLSDQEKLKDLALQRCAGLLAEPEAAQPSSFELLPAVSPQLYRDEILTSVIKRIEAGELTKAVLAREITVKTDCPVDQAGLLARLAQRFGSACLFNVEGFLGASPELLVSRIDQVVSAHPLAGTAPRSSDVATDARNAAGLVASDKNRHEHMITIQWLLDNLLPFCSFVDAEPEPTIVSLANVHHLGTKVQGVLSSPAASVLELVAALHPTPALGGAPQDKALEIIAEVEPGDRGKYGGPVGWVDAMGNGEFAVAIRSGQINGTTMSVWAGGGIVRDSDPHAELEETRNKLQAMLGSLIRP